LIIITTLPFKDRSGEDPMEKLFEQIITSIGEDLNREGLQKTPKRAAEAFKFITKGYNITLEEIINGALFESDCDDMIMVKDIELYSLCEHHLLPFIGKCHVGYIPKGKILGLSKIPRIVDMFARRLQVQETLTSQIAHTIFEITDCLGVAVVMEAQHLCMMMRGVEKQNSVMKTSSMLGVFRNDRAARSEFLSLITK
jgi:GTP cyclohydrolase I